ncbi:PVC-type heme-binding CxxCH protein [Anatilimnocola floriformis]|uniref:PVC-type heme-binding CxxCH protein n=1 Tax=Anatilimnocola floriformis TaxID=2948575 RepID=UPI0020C1F931|nr:PVC-type heme-binding CxxCH protein [Anatilimnocola floriformis]
MKHLSLLFVALLLVGVSRAAFAADPFAEGVRTTPWLSPADEQKAFKLPPGFEINLVAAEPDIQKPLNMQFDEQGRIWLTCTVEYPYAAPSDRPAKDSIRVLEDTDGDGRFEKMTIFAEGLNIPMGIYPWKGGCIAFNIPDIVHFEDTDGDLKCDKRTKLYGPFDTTRDTHGMCNAFRRGFDGWVYACHGFNNNSKVKGADGNEVVMNSGNTFRFKLDGSRIENYTFGQVNPFGMCLDERFNIFTADCHSKPVYQLLLHGQYPGFGRKDDGLGFVPPMMEHLHGSTAIAGVCIYSGDNFPEKYRGLFYSGNVMTSRINCNAAEYHGSTIKAKEQPDFLSTEDPWFRPVDIHIGPDGGMYILDFYNRIIGHYEVPLPHPGRDRTSGRIWRVTYKGDDAATKPVKMPKSLKGLSTAELLKELDNSNLQRRLQVQHYVTDVVGAPAATEVQDYFAKVGEKSPGYVHGMWMVEALLKDKANLGSPEGELAWIHHAKALANRATADVFTDIKVVTDAKSPPFARRASADAIAMHPENVPVAALLAALREVPGDDNHLSYAIRQALKSRLQVAKSPAEVLDWKLTAAQINDLAPICLAVNNGAAGTLLLSQIESGSVNREQMATYMQHVAKNAAGDIVARVAPIAQKQLGNDLPMQAQMISAIFAGLATRGEEPKRELFDWANEVAIQLLSPPATEVFSWQAAAVEGAPPSQQPWVIVERKSSDSEAKHKFYDSLARGETLTGSYRSSAFDLPEKLSFWCAGHHGVPGAKGNDLNKILLRDADTKEVLAESRPPRNDIAQKTEWDLKKFAGKRGYIELIDGDTGTGYAWFAVGRFSLAALNPLPQIANQAAGAELVARFKLTGLRPRLGELLGSEKTDPAVRAAAGQAFVALETAAPNRAIATALGSTELIGVDRGQLLNSLTSGDEKQVATALQTVLKASSLRLQTLIAETLTSDAGGVEVLFALVKAGQASPRLLMLPAINTRLQTLKTPNWKEQVAELTAGLPTDAEARDKLIAERKLALEKNMASGVRGGELFTKHCAACHQIAGKGNVVGPQLDGIGLRGRDRLLEDILDPNRNVDVAFRTTTLQLADGRVLSGLFRREEGALLVLVDPQGKEFTVPKADVEEKKQTQLSLMPANVGETITPTDFADLATYLLEQKTAKKAE